MKTRNREQIEEISDVEFEAALHAALREQGKFFPRNAEEAAAFVANVDLNHVPTPDAQKFHEFLEQITKDKVAPVSNYQQICALVNRTSMSVKKFISTDWLRSGEIDTNLECLSYAARNGKEITVDIRKQMDADKSRSHVEQIPTKHGCILR